jgi:prophage regulatory protein
MLTDVPKHLMGAREIEERLGVSRQRVYQLTRRADWPEPYDILAMGAVWRTEDVEAWIRLHRPDQAGAEEGR